jgi:hypothetical protein
MAASHINLKGWLIFSEPNPPSPPTVVWAKPSVTFLKSWNTEAVPVLIRRVRAHKKDTRIEFDYRDGGWFKVMEADRCVQDFRDPREAETFRRALVGGRAR